jgi:hypothetical protein
MGDKHFEQRINIKFLFRRGKKQSSLGMKVGFFNMTLRQSGGACSGNLQAYPAPGKHGCQNQK